MIMLWRTKIIRKVCRSSKDAELLSLSTLCDQSLHLGKQLEEILENKRDGSKYKPILFIDNAPCLESIVSSKLIERRYLRPDVEIIKQLLENKEVCEIRWIPDEMQISDVLTKDKQSKPGLMELMSYGKLKAVLNRDNYVYHDSDFVMKGRHLRSAIIKNKKTPIKKRRKGSLLAQQEIEEMKKENGGELLAENDVMWINVLGEWIIDDSYIFRPE